MRIFSTILLLNILLLTIAPQLSIPSFFNHKKLTHKSCCSNHKKKEGKMNDCCRYACNPFMACCNCSALVTSYPGITVPFHYSNWSYKIYSETWFPGFLSKAWNPPKTG